MARFIYALSIVLIIIAPSALAQNFVPNWSFEDTVSCPQSLSFINYAQGWSAYSGSPDYFHSCSQLLGTPQNIIDYQVPRTGQAYAGIYVFASTLMLNTIEAIGIQLNQSLAVGTKYFVKFYVSRAVRNTSGGYINIANDKIGIHLSTNSYSSPPIIPDNNSPVYSSNIISDTLNWVEISGSFIADSNYQYLAISSFFEPQLINYLSFDSTSFLSYYFIDDVCLSPDSIYCDQLLNSINTYENYETNTFHVYPNPANEFINVDGLNIQLISIYNSNGKLVKIMTALNQFNKIYTSLFADGIYFVSIVTNKNKLENKIVIINHNNTKP